MSMSDMAKLLHLMETLANEDKVEKIIEKCNFIIHTFAGTKYSIKRGVYVNLNKMRPFNCF